MEIFKYFGKDSLITWRKYYSNEKYDLDSLAEVKMSIFRTKRWDYGNNKYTYKKDKFGNWIEKTSKGTNDHEIHYRKYTY